MSNVNSLAYDMARAQVSYKHNRFQQTYLNMQKYNQEINLILK